MNLEARKQNNHTQAIAISNGQYLRQHTLSSLFSGSLCPKTNKGAIKAPLFIQLLRDNYAVLRI